MGKFQKTIEFGLYLLIFLLPLETHWLIKAGIVNGEYGMIKFYGIDILLLMLLLLCGICFFKKLSQSHSEQSEESHHQTQGVRSFGLRPQDDRSVVSFPVSKIWYLIAALELIAFLSIFWAGEKGLAVYGWLRLLLAIGLFWLVVSLRAPEGRNNSDHLSLRGAKPRSNPGRAWHDKIGYLSNLTSEIAASLPRIKCGVAPRNDNATKYKLALAFVAGAVVQAGLGIYQFLTQSVFASKWLGMAAHYPWQLGASVIETEGERWLRAYGTLPHPNILGGYLAIAIILCFYLYFSLKSEARNPKSETNSKFFKFILYTSCFILLVGLFFTFSRSAWLALLVGLVFLLFERSRELWTSRLRSPWSLRSPPEADAPLAQKNKLLAISPMLLAVVVLTITFWPLVLTRLGFSDYQRLEVKAVEQRLSGYDEAWQIIKAHPMAGVGINNYTPALSKTNPNQPAYTYQPPHNIFLLIWAELGLIGLAVFIFLYFYIFAKFVRVERGYKFEHPPLADIQCKNWFPRVIVIVIVMLAIFDHYLWSLHFGLLLLFFVMAFGKGDHRLVSNSTSGIVPLRGIPRRGTSASRPPRNDK